ncbi:MAG: hypothetical protein JOZ41_03685, partial [Chloroflexi bacterium]|nr:hypothetical protein [Chloroflexota bacterium]
PRGGGGGGGGGGGPVTVYRRFADTGYWSANVLTDASGHASVRVVLPDNFTTWRLDARGVTADRRVGQARLLTVSTQDIVLRPVTPRFLLQGDTVRLGVVVNNNLAEPVTTGIALAATGLDAGAGGNTTVTVPPHGERLVLWRAGVPATGSARLTFRASPSTSGVQGYALQVRLPVHPPLTDETVATSGQVLGAIRQAVVVPEAALPRPGSLTVQVTSSLTAGMGRALSQLKAQQYESNEDVADRLLAAGALHSLPAALSGLAPAAYSRLPAVILSAMAKLVSAQLPDGGWPWFNGPAAQSDAQITADALEALSVAGSAPSATLARARSSLRSALPGLPADERARVLLILARSGGGAGTAAEALNGDTVTRSHLDPSALADLAWALYLGGDRGAARSLIAELDSRAMVSATGAHWEAPIDAGQTPVAATAHVLAALLGLAPSDPFVPAAARWLMLARDGVSWDCPPDTARALSALSVYARAAREGRASYRYGVVVDGASRLEGRFTPATVRQAGNASVPIAALHRGGGSLVIVRRPEGGSLGRGPLYYVARLRYYLPATAIKPRNEGVSISRRYLDLAGHPLTSAPAGSVVRVELTVSSGQSLVHLDVEDPVPAGFEPIDLSLKASRQGLAGALPAPPPGTADLSPYLDHTDLRDDRVSLYASSLPPGTYRYSYLAQATVAGQYDVAPSRASESFFPEVFGRSAGGTFTVR